MKIAAMLNKDFQETLVAVGQQRIDAPTALTLKRILKKINEELSNYNAVLSDIQKRNTNEEGVVNQEAFAKEYGELVNMEVDMPKVHVDKLMGTQMSVKDLELMEPILEGLDS